MEPLIITDLKKSYGISCDQITPVSGGWLNKKWKVFSSDAVWLVKQYSNQRFCQRQLFQIEAALHRQIRLEITGFPCPHVLLCGGHAIRMTENGISYMVMGFCPGKIESPSTLTQIQMSSLGAVCGRMHQAFSKLLSQGVKGFPVLPQRLLDSLQGNYMSCKERFKRCPSQNEFRKDVLLQKKILQTLEESFFHSLPKGIAHEDFSPDNMLFQPEGVCAILDFDRNQYSFPWHDIGRAFLSFALKQGTMDLQMIRGFLHGYAAYRPLKPKDVVAALRVTWCIETPWWIQPEFYQDASTKTMRFREELSWLTRHWFDLESIFSVL